MTFTLVPITQNIIDVFHTIAGNDNIPEQGLKLYQNLEMLFMTPLGLEELNAMIMKIRRK